MEDQEPSKVETIVKVCVLLWSATLLSLSYYEPPSGKKIVDLLRAICKQTSNTLDDRAVDMLEQQLFPKMN